MVNDKKRLDQSGVEPNLLNRISKIDPDRNVLSQGLGGDPLSEGTPQLIKTLNEKVFENGNNASIVLGRDRPASRLSGYGGSGHSQCGSIDIVVGRMGYKARGFSVSGQRVWVDPDFAHDAARIYISQKTDVDKNFGLTFGKVGNAKTKSAIALKADGLRFIAREGIKLITKVDDRNSQGGQNQSIVGVDLIAGNDDGNLQPMVLGHNLTDALRRLVVHVDKLNGIVDSLLMTQMTMNQALVHHFHFSPFFGLPTTPSIPVVAVGIKTMVDHLLQTKMSLISNKVNLSLYKQKYTQPFGGSYILSRHHHLN